jgi:peptide-methionine (S)-S-oxide reductase
MVTTNFRATTTRFAAALLSLLGIAAFSQSAQSQSTRNQQSRVMTTNESSAVPVGLAKATFGTGCFWCTEAMFETLDGVQGAVSGYEGGAKPNPTYKEVCSGSTGHAECIQITYDPTRISFDELLEVFWKTHDPTTLNRQGNDVGTQYRSGIFYHNEEQRLKAEQYKIALDRAGAWSNPIVTEISPFTIFYPAEDYHQQYMELNGNSNPYCQFVIQPKLDKFRKVFAEKLKKD